MDFTSNRYQKSKEQEEARVNHTDHVWIVHKHQPMLLLTLMISHIEIDKHKAYTIV